MSGSIDTDFPHAEQVRAQVEARLDEQAAVGVADGVGDLLLLEERARRRLAVLLGEALAHFVDGLRDVGQRGPRGFPHGLLGGLRLREQRGQVPRLVQGECIMGQHLSARRIDLVRVRGQRLPGGQALGARQRAGSGQREAQVVGVEQLHQALAGGVGARGRDRLRRDARHRRVLGQDLRDLLRGARVADEAERDLRVG
jgi:hypothetical protein